VSRLLPWLLLIAAPLARAETPPTLPCEPSAACALTMSREAAFRLFASARDSAQRQLALAALTWSGPHEPAGDAALRARFSALAKQLDAHAAEDPPSLRASLVEAMAGYGFLEDASALATTLSSQGSKDLVQKSLACGHVRRGNLREAFAILEKVEDADINSLTLSVTANCIARTGKPELARDAAKYWPDSPTKADWITHTIAITEQDAGQHAAARASAMSIKDDQWREDLLFQLMHRYRHDRNYPEALATERLLLGEAVKRNDAQARKTALEFLLGDLLASKAPGQEVLALLDTVPADFRARAVDKVLQESGDPAVILDAGKRLAELPKAERELRQPALLLARVRAADLKPADALKLAGNPRLLEEGLLRIAQNLGKDQAALAREALQAAISANEKREEYSWTSFAAAQAALGLLKEAHETIDSRIKDPGWRGYALVRVSGAEAAQGKLNDSARSRAEGVRLLTSVRHNSNEYAIADILLDDGYPEQAQAELLVAIQRKLPGPEYRETPRKVVTALVKRGDSRRALVLASALSEYALSSPENLGYLPLQLAAERLVNE